MSSRIIQLQCYFELKEELAFFALVVATQKYLRCSRKLSDYHKNSTGNFLRVAKKLFQIRNNKQYLSDRAFRQKLDTLRGELLSLEPVVKKDWLWSKVEEF